MIYYKKVFKQIKFFYYFNDLLKLIIENIKVYLLSNNKLVFIQIPRTNSSLIKDIIQNKVKIKSMFYISDHFLKPKYSNPNKYFVSIRDPIDRFVSAYFHLKNNQFKSFYGDFFKVYPNINVLAEKIFSKKAQNYIRLSHHINENFQTFFNIEKLRKNKPFFVIDINNFENDIQLFFKFILKDKKKIRLNFNKKKIKKYKSYLSLKSRRNLKKYLAKDYFIYHELKKIRKKIIYKMKFNI